MTTEDIMGFVPCSDWPEERVRRYVGAGIQPENFLDLQDLFSEEFLWLIVRREVMSEQELLDFGVLVCHAILELDGAEARQNAELVLQGWPDRLAAAWQVVGMLNRNEVAARILREGQWL